MRWVRSFRRYARSLCRHLPAAQGPPGRGARSCGCEVTGIGTGVHDSSRHPSRAGNVNKLFADLCARSGVRRIRFQDLRHSCATLLYELGVPIENIQDVLGHSTPVITKLLYVDGPQKMQRAAADRLGSLFEGLDQ